MLAAGVIGASKPHILFREILPGGLPAIVSKMTLDAGCVILIVPSRSFPGRGGQPPTPDLGAMAAEG